MPTKHRLIAALLATLPLAGSAGAAQLLPAGAFAARDGRPGPGKQWLVSDAQGAKLAAALNAIAAKTPIVIDYDHQTLHAEKNGQKAPAAGWVTSVEWRAGAGLFAKVDWTAAAKAHIDAGEYRYISPVIIYDAAGEVTGVLLAALVNYPAIVGMDAVIAELSGLSTHDNQESHMDLLAALAALFSLPAGVTPDAALAYLKQLKTQLDGTAALKTKLGLPETADMAALTAKVAALQADTARLGDTAAATMAALQAQLAALTKQINAEKVVALVDAALRSGKLVPAMRDWALDLGAQDIARLQSYIDKAPATGLGAPQSGGKPAAGGDNSAALSAAQADVIARLGITPEQFAKAAPAAA